MMRPIDADRSLLELLDLADEFSEVDENGLHNDRWCGIMDSKGVIANAPIIELKQEWIPCSERLPKESGVYLVCGNNKVWICELIKVGATIGWANKASNPVVKAWMPLPPAWKGADDDN